MSDLTFNKIAGAALATGLAIIGLGQLSAGIFATEKPEKPGYLVEVTEEGGGDAAAVELAPDWGTVLPTADVAAGEAAFAKCRSCHSIQQGGPNGTGPDIWGVAGRKPGVHGGFAYSSGMTEFGAKQPVWDYDHLNDFIKAPQKYIAGTKMTFVGIKKQDERINLIAYLASQGGTLPLPAPDPSRDPAAVAAAAAAATPAAEGAATPASAEGQPTATGSTAAPTVPGGGPAGQAPASPGAVPTATPAKK